VGRGEIHRPRRSLARKPAGKNHLEDLGANVSEGIGLEGVDCILMVQGREKLRAVVSEVTNLWLS
jgi:hypothetical protein